MSRLRKNDPLHPGNSFKERRCGEFSNFIIRAINQECGLMDVVRIGYSGPVPQTTIDKEFGRSKPVKRLMTLMKTQDCWISLGVVII